MPLKCNLFWPCDEKRETRIFCENWNVQRKMLNGLTNWLKVGQGTDAVKAMRDRDARKVMIA